MLFFSCPRLSPLTLKLSTQSGWVGTIQEPIQSWWVWAALVLEPQPQPSPRQVTGSPAPNPSPLPCPELLMWRDMSELHVPAGWSPWPRKTWGGFERGDPCALTPFLNQCSPRKVRVIYQGRKRGSPSTVLSACPLFLWTATRKQFSH